jgi:hypothetical protein
VHVTEVHLPALNTPQFSWVKNRLPHKPQPVPPIFQPEVAARAIHWAAHQRRREVYVGGPTVKAIVGNKISPGLADWYLARYGYEAQQTDVPEDPRRADNLWAPLTGDHGAHGGFDRRARTYSIQFWMTTHRRSIALAGLLLGAWAFAASSKTGRLPWQR